MSDHTGGPAFPTQGYDQGAAMNGIGVTVTEDPGMTLRDYFAGQALAGMIPTAAAPCLHGFKGDERKIIADAAYLLADAMLAARKEQPHD